MSKTKAAPFKPYKTKEAQPGDIIAIKAGMHVYIDLPEHFCYANRAGVFDKLAQTDLKVGSNERGLDTNFLVGKYIVVAAHMGGGGTGHGPHDVFPDGWFVRAKMVNSPERTISFYMSGCFTAMVPEVEVVGKAKQNWEVEA